MTQDTKWISGPWFVGAMNDALFVIDQKPRPAPVDEINPTALDGIAVICGPVSEPEAHLIAAAPELYEALDGIIANTDQYGFADQSWFEAGRSALAKACGEAK